MLSDPTGQASVTYTYKPTRVKKRVSERVLPRVMHIIRTESLPETLSETLRETFGETFRARQASCQESRIGLYALLLARLSPRLGFLRGDAISHLKYYVLRLIHGLRNFA